MSLFEDVSTLFAAAITDGQDNEAIVKAAYEDLLGYADADTMNNSAARIDYWVQKLSSGELTTDNFGGSFLEEANTNQGSLISSTTFENNQTVVAAHEDAYEANPDVTLEDLTAVAAENRVEDVAEEDEGVTGETFTLTTDVESLTGTAGDDSFIASDATFNTGDVLNGAEGTDKLNLTLTAVNTDLVDTESIEQAYIRTTVDTSGVGDEVNASGWEGLQQLWSDRSTDVLAVTGVQSGVTLGINDTTQAYTVGYADNAIGSTTATQSVVLTGEVTSTLTLTVGGTDAITTLDVSADDESNFTIADGDLGAVETINLSGAGALELVDDDDEFDAVETVDASASTGGVTIDLATAAQAVTFTGGDAVDTVTASGNGDTINTGEGADSVTLADADAAVTVDAGAGDDTVVASAATVDLSNTDVSLGGGDGSDTIEVAKDQIDELTADADSRAAVTGFEILSTSGLATAEDFDISDVAGGFSQLVSDATEDVTVSGFANDGSVTLTGQQATGGATFAVAGAGDAGRNDDTFNITLDEDADANGETVTVAEVENINLTSTDDEANATSNSLSLVANDATDVTVDGDEDLDLTDGGNDNSSLNSIQTLNAADLTGDLTVELSSANQGVVVTAGSGGSTITGSANADIINAGAGVDSITGGDGADAIKLTADGETDTVVYTDADEGSATGTAGGSFSGQDVITGFEAGANGDTVDVSAFVTGGTTEVGQLTAQETAADNDIFIVDASESFVDGDTETVADLADVDDVVAYLREGVDASGFTGNEQMFFALSNVGGETGLYAYTDDGTANAIQADEMTLLGTTDSADFTADNIA